VIGGVLGGGRLLLLAWSWRRWLLAAVLALVAVPAVLAAGLMGAMGRVDTMPLTDPLPGGVLTQRFGCTELAFEPWSAECPGHRFHSGVDLAAATHTPILAATSGLASAARMRGGYGLYVVIERDPGGRFATLYGHLSLALVVSGDLVQAGQPIGLVGSSGTSTGPHLHFEVRLKGVPVDPMPYLPPRRPGGGG
jgi:murein DD-endopeptidase MepM/ murein hydrolase activator NlpD